VVETANKGHATPGKNSTCQSSHPDCLPREARAVGSDRTSRLTIDGARPLVLERLEPIFVLNLRLRRPETRRLRCGPGSGSANAKPTVIGASTTVLTAVAAAMRLMRFIGTPLGVWPWTLQGPHHDRVDRHDLRYIKQARVSSPPGEVRAVVGTAQVGMLLEDHGQVVHRCHIRSRRRT
jgi:hypothetical protein